MCGRCEIMYTDAHVKYSEFWVGPSLQPREIRSVTGVEAQIAA